MYIPNTNLMSGKSEAVEFMQRFNFATIISAKSDFPMATHLPFLVSFKDDIIILTSHFAKANEHWKLIETDKILVIFSEPHAYISPKNYEKKLNVPTWNYISVHAYGQGRIINDQENVLKVLENTINTFESEYMHQWDLLPHDYKDKMSKAIVAFEVRVTDLQAKKKLSQNKTEAERLNIIDSLSKSANTNEHLIADYMKKDLSNI
ncbi:MAG: FMN-binding negative transcriptional regulator [Saprospiraceae bacterium]